jgi:hypothetical protein
LFGLFKTLGEQHNFGDESVVGDHHADGSEENFEVVWQLGSTCVAGVHGDEDAATRTQVDVAVVEEKYWVSTKLSYPDCQQLLGDDR